MATGDLGIHGYAATWGCLRGRATLEVEGHLRKTESEAHHMQALSGKEFISKFQAFVNQAGALDCFRSMRAQMEHEPKQQAPTSRRQLGEPLPLRAIAADDYRRLRRRSGGRPRRSHRAGLREPARRLRQRLRPATCRI